MQVQLTQLLENKKVTGPVIAVLSLMVLFLYAWKSGTEAPKHRILEEDEPVKVHKVEAAAKVPAATFSEDLDSYVTTKRTYEFQHAGTKYRRECRMQAVPTSSCTRLSCVDGKVYCVSSYMEL